MYRLIEVNMNDKVLDATCDSGAFLVKFMCNMMIHKNGKTNLVQLLEIKRINMTAKSLQKII